MLRFNHLILIVLLCFSGCTSGPEPIAFGKDQCHYCRMTISDPKFGAELITEKGRAFKFDATECMINFLEEENPNYKDLYAIAYDQPQELFPVDSLSFIVSKDYRSPMGANLAAFSKGAANDQFISWNQLYDQLTGSQ